MTRSVIIHAVVEMLVLSSITVFLNRRIKAGEDVIRGLKKQVDNLQTTVNTMQKNMDHLYSMMEQMAMPPMMMPGMRHRRPMQQPMPPQPQPQPSQPQPQSNDEWKVSSPFPGDLGVGGMMQGLLSAMMQPQVVQITTNAPQKPQVEIADDDGDDSPEIKAALDELLKETIEETSGLKEDQQQQVNAQ
jgi:hypothetical protein